MYRTILQTRCQTILQTSCRNIFIGLACFAINIIHARTTILATDKNNKTETYEIRYNDKTSSWDDVGTSLGMTSDWVLAQKVVSPRGKIKISFKDARAKDLVNHILSYTKHQRAQTSGVGAQRQPVSVTPVEPILKIEVGLDAKTGRYAVSKCTISA